jgi:hypothetical protein
VPEYTFRLRESFGKPLIGLTWATVDYLDESGFGEPSGFLLEVRDRQSRTIYRHQGYEPKQES